MTHFTLVSPFSARSCAKMHSKNECFSKTQSSNPNKRLVASFFANPAMSISES